MNNPFDALAGAGVSVWLDDLSRTRITSGSLETMVKSGIVGITTNPTIFAKSIASGSGYEPQIRDLALRGTAIGETLRLVTAWDVRAACDVLQPVFARTSQRDGRVSIEVDPRISADSGRTTAEARGLWWLVDRPNLFIKIPATKPALPAITASIAEGLSVNVTLIFSIDRYRAVLDAYMTGLEKRLSYGESLSGIESVASFFISRVDTEVDKRLTELGDPANQEERIRNLRGQAAIANARLAYQVYRETAASDRWRALEAKGGALQRLLWASTGVKDKSYPATRYVTELVAPHTVNTMPEETLKALGALTGRIADSVSDRITEARAVVDGLAALGINMDDVANTLERDGIASFVRSWNELVDSVERQLQNAGADVSTSGAVKPALSATSTANAPAAAAPSQTAAASV